MNLNDTNLFARLDPQHMLAEIEGLPQQLSQAWQLGQTQPLPDWENIHQVLITGMGGSAIGADLLAAYANPLGTVPIIVLRNYDLPGWARGPETLVVASSHSGNTEETMATFTKALESGSRVLAVTRGGKLGEAAEKAGVPLWTFAHEGQPRAAVGYSFGLLLGMMVRLNFLPDASRDIESAVSAMQVQQQQLQASVEVEENPAKRMAGQLYGRYVTIFGADVLEPVARRWKGQMSEVAKAVASFEALPEADHNTLAGVLNPDAVLRKVFALFLRAPSYHERNRLRTELTKRGFMLEGLNTDFIDAVGDTRLAHQWTALHFGDYTAYYLAMAYDVDPTPVEAIESLKVEMKRAAPI